MRTLYSPPLLHGSTADLPAPFASCVTSHGPPAIKAPQRVKACCRGLCPRVVPDGEASVSPEPHPSSGSGELTASVTKSAPRRRNIGPQRKGLRSRSFYYPARSDTCAGNAFLFTRAAAPLPYPADGITQRGRPRRVPVLLSG